MKKKLVVMLLAVFSASTFVYAFQFSLLPLGYMNHTVRTRYTVAELSSDFVNNIGSIEGATFNSNASFDVQEGYHAYTAGADIYFAHIYAGIRLGLPTTMIKAGDVDPLQSYYKDLSEHGIQKVKSYIVDTQFGFYGSYSGSKFATVFGLGGVLNYISVEQQLRTTSIPLKNKTMMESPSFMNEALRAGLGGNVSFSFRFTSFAAITFTVTDSVIFYPVKEVRYLKGQVNGATVTTTPRTQKSHNVQLGNNFTASIGISFGTF